jgi:dolichyl-phosphate beta-glucosyltransferase
VKELKKKLKSDHASIVIPLYNEELRLDYCFSVIKKFIRKKGKLFLEIIFVDDGSNDTSKKKIINFINKNKKNFLNTKIKLISYKKNMGKGNAIKRGILTSRYEWIITCDLDMSVLPDQFLTWKKKKLINNKKYAYFGSRENKDSVVQTLYVRRIIGFILHIFIWALFNIKTSDTQCGFKVFHSNYIKKIFKKIKMKGYVYDVEVVLALKKEDIKIIELPLTWIHKEGSKVNLIKDSVKFFFDLIILKIRF